MKNQLKFKKLLNQYRSMFYDLEYVNVILKDAYVEFDEWKKRYCDKKHVKITELNQKHSNRIKQIFSTGTAIKKRKEEQRKQPYDSKKIFRQIARKFHPDKLSADDPNLKEYEGVFKKATAAIDNGSWTELFDIAERYDLTLEDYESINKLIAHEIQTIQQEINTKKSTYAWLLYHCDQDEDKDKLMKKFLNHIYIEW
jgi:hypothetical protein